MIVVDTNVVSHLFNGDHIAPYYRKRLQGHIVVISFQTLEELWYGASWRGWGAKRRTQFTKHLNQYTVIWSSPQLVEICAGLRSRMRSSGHTLQVADAWIAATAVMLGCPLASQDKNFASVPNLQLIPAM